MVGVKEEGGPAPLGEHVRVGEASRRRTVGAEEVGEVRQVFEEELGEEREPEGDAHGRQSLAAERLVPEPTPALAKASQGRSVHRPVATS